MAALQTMLKQPSDLAIPGGEKIWSQCSVVGLHDRAASVNLGPFHHHNYVSKVLRRVWHARPLELWCWCWCCCWCWCWSFQASLTITIPESYISKVLRRVWHARPLEPHQLSRSLPDLLVSKGLHIFYEDILNNLNIFIYISLQYI